jgi:uncharacterized protein YjgD (DUF1641 family)
MAQPIPLELPPQDARAELRRRLEEAPVAYAEALLDSYEMLQQMHAQGVFEMLRGALGAKDRMVEAVAGAASSDEAVRAMRNGIILTKMLGAINPEVLQCIAGAAGETLGCYDKPIIEPPGLFSLLSQFRHKELRRSIALINRFLEKLGEQMHRRSKDQGSS